MRAMSNKRRRQMNAFAEIRRQVFERDDHSCQMPRHMNGHYCWGPLAAHHIKRRSAGGTDDPSNLVTLCARAHDWVHNNPAEAALFGLLALRDGRTPQ